MKYTLTIDVSLLSVKTTLIDENNAQRQHELPLATTDAERATITPDQIYNQTLAAIKEANKLLLDSPAAKVEEIIFSEISLDGLMPLDKDFAPLMPVIYGKDTQKYVDALTMNGVTGQLQRKMGLSLLDTTPFVLILWLKNERPDIYEQAVHYMSLQSYIIYRLFGKNIISRAYAARTGLYDLVTDEWDTQALALSGLTTAALPEVTNFSDEMFALSDEIATRTGISVLTTFHLK
ncbi:FGGY family carbohydrate kinase [Weissella fangxianensis]|uniref:FGGY family carbohydrate kinase n=1 Tax=Weissella fangxianensis TaxID=2953879 RepID=UPI0021586C0C|nr:FGGY family carbohydrate kinase [Weissella fangxianensis]